ncbi:MAG: hypothetical protein U0836_14170 [Pirellulales bacterium]
MRLAFAASLLLALAAGCRSRGELEILERELRLQEDQIYQLEDELQGTKSQLEAVQRENDTLRAKAEGSGATTAPSGSTRVLPGPAPDAEMAPRADAGAQTDAAPKVDLGSPANANELPGPAPENLAPPEIELQSGRRTASRGLTAIAIHRQLTGGRDFDGHAGDDGLAVVLEMRDGAGNLVRADGKLKLVLEDPRLGPSATPVAQWDFAGDELRQRYRQTALGGGLHFELPWPGRPPEASRLKLTARFTDRAGRVFAAQRTIDVNPPAEWLSRGDDSGREEREATRRPRTLDDSPKDSRQLPATEASGDPAAPAQRPSWKPYR